MLFLRVIFNFPKMKTKDHYTIRILNLHLKYIQAVITLNPSIIQNGCIRDYFPKQVTPFFTCLNFKVAILTLLPNKCMSRKHVFALANPSYINKSPPPEHV